VNRLVHGSASPGQFATFFLARVDETRLRLAYSNAGHNYPVVLRAGRKERVFLERGGTVIGIRDDVPFEEDAVALETGDLVVFYTDGISEAANAHGEQFGEERLCAAVEILPGEASAREVTEAVLAALTGFLDGTEPRDDVTLMVLRVLAPSELLRSGEEAFAPAVVAPA
jgi:phosphoserine phosphatase RsbU/P